MSANGWVLTGLITWGLLLLLLIFAMLKAASDQDDAQELEHSSHENERERD